ncbi:putative dehydrogenase [Thermosipho japonicus]|uniref:Putative dehydrogenase n=1 Tax=Thermosipho japonicus TaxID=90323 RepID=A0A841GRD3_9BACT|nr:Gfo/Idh/MocA family oxidoreductase [Thermosipho japonicus]MBB6061580.1 putative dehydrogenase [Thermosipho japonicus]
MEKETTTYWRKKPQHIGGFLSDAGVHHVAAMRLILGDIDWVTAYTKDFSDYLAGPDFISTIVEFKNGVIGNYIASYSFNEEEQFEIYGKENTLKVLKNKILYN